MTHDPGADLRDRFRATPLPPAPVRLREHLEAVALAPSVTARPRFGGARLVLSFVALLAIASIGLVAGGGLGDPSPSTLTAEATAEATVEATPDTTAEPFPFQLVCEEAEAPALTCAEVALRLLDLLNLEVADSGTIATIEVSRPCDTPCLPMVTFAVTFVSGNLVDGSIGPGELFQMMSSETDIPTEVPGP